MDILTKYDRKIPSDVNSICETVCDVIHYIQRSYGQLDDCTLFELQVMLNELLINAIRHGNKESKEKQVRISAGLTKRKSLVLCIEDEGNGYDYKSLLMSNAKRENNLDILEMKETGRGLLIVKNLCSNIRFNKEGNRIILLKKLTVCCS